MLATLFSCCLAPRAKGPRHGRAPLDANPTETTNLIPTSASEDLTSLPPSNDGIDHQKLQERYGSIVRAKESKMVNLTARAPFVLQVVSPSSSTPVSPVLPNQEPAIDADMPTPAAKPSTSPVLSSQPILSRRPPILTMTPAVVRPASRMTLGYDSRFSSPNTSRSSSRRRPEFDGSSAYRDNRFSALHGAQQHMHPDLGSTWRRPAFTAAESEWPESETETEESAAESDGDDEEEEEEEESVSRGSQDKHKPEDVDAKVSPVSCAPLASRTTTADPTVAIPVADSTDTEDPLDIAFSWSDA
ncbi:unnamed protein product [Mycena citricolor]|uniref:Uncharacterized protein n=1 Tax=Mycena citricolor TaxID=2018698 RepID=A0AAD2H020_9AGAR|nr:unnamed protein product [Mycena citricolor]